MTSQPPASEDARHRPTAVPPRFTASPPAPTFDGAVVAQCWAIQLALTIGLLTLSLLMAAIRDDFTLFLHDPGVPGWRLFCALMPLYGLMSVAALAWRQRPLRWLYALLLGASAAVPVLHQFRHWTEGKPPDASVAVEAAMVAVALVGTTASVRWARRGAP